MVVKTMEAQLGEFALKSRERATACFREAAEDFVEVMQKVGPNAADPSAGEGGAMPVVSGFLRASLQATNSEMPLANRENPNSSGNYSYEAGPVSLVIRGTDLGQSIHVGYTANYAVYVENMYGFVRLASMQWQQIVSRASERIRKSVEG